MSWLIGAGVGAAVFTGLPRFLKTCLTVVLFILVVFVCLFIWAFMSGGASA